METCEAVQGAMNAFWRSGYNATSLTDLELATGLKKGSLYKAFEDKHDLYIQALEMYLSMARKAIGETIEQPGTAMEALCRWAERAKTGCSTGGCLAVKSTDELAAHDPEVRQMLVNHWEAIKELLTKVIERGQADGSVRTDISLNLLADLIIRVAMGSSVAAQLTAQDQRINAMDTALALLKA